MLPWPLYKLCYYKQTLLLPKGLAISSASDWWTISDTILVSDLFTLFVYPFIDNKLLIA